MNDNVPRRNVLASVLAAMTLPAGSALAAMPAPPLRGDDTARLPDHAALWGRMAELALDIVDRIVAILDEGDGDPDREDGGDAEPCLGAPEGHESQVIWLRGGDDDREAD